MTFQLNPANLQTRIVYCSKNGQWTEGQKWRFDNCIFKIFRRLIWPDSRIENVVQGLAQKAEVITPTEAPNFVQYVAAFNSQVIDKHNARLWWFQKPVDTSQLDQECFYLFRRHGKAEEILSSLSKESLKRYTQIYLSHPTTGNYGFPQKEYEENYQFFLGHETRPPKSVWDAKYAATHMPHGVEAWLFQHALNHNLKTEAAQIYARVLQHTAFLAIQLHCDPELDSGKRWSEVVKPLREERLTFLREKISFVKMDPVWKDLFLNRQPEQIDRLFTYLLAPFKADPTGPPNSIEYFSGTAAELLNIYQEVTAFAEKYPDLKLFAEDYIVNPQKLVELCEFEVRRAKVGTGAVLNEKIISDLYPLLPARHAVTLGFGDKGPGLWGSIAEKWNQIPRGSISSVDTGEKKIAVLLPTGKTLNIATSLLKKSKTLAHMLENSAFSDAITLEILNSKNQQAFIDLVYYLSTEQIEVKRETGPYILGLACHLDLQLMFPLVFQWARWLNKSFNERTEFTLEEYRNMLEDSRTLNLPRIAERLCVHIYDTKFRRDSASEGRAPFKELLSQYGKSVGEIYYRGTWQIPLADFCQYFPEVRKLKIVFCPFDFAFAKALASLKALEEVELLSGCSLDITALLLLKNCPTLKSLKAKEKVRATNSEIPVQALTKNFPAFDVELKTSVQGSQVTITELTLTKKEAIN